MPSFLFVPRIENPLRFKKGWFESNLIALESPFSHGKNHSFEITVPRWSISTFDNLDTNTIFHQHLINGKLLFSGAKNLNNYKHIGRYFDTQEGAKEYVCGYALFQTNINKFVLLLGLQIPKNKHWLSFSFQDYCPIQYLLLMLDDHIIDTFELLKHLFEEQQLKTKHQAMHYALSYFIDFQLAQRNPPNLVFSHDEEGGKEHVQTSYTLLGLKFTYDFELCPRKSEKSPRKFDGFAVTVTPQDGLTVPQEETLLKRLNQDHGLAEKLFKLIKIRLD